MHVARGGLFSCGMILSRDRARDLATTLAMVAAVMAAAKDDWWIIGSAAVALHGADVAVADVDVLASVADAQRILPGLAVDAFAGPEDALFRSEVFGRWLSPPLAVEIMAGFAVRDGAGWTPVVPATRERRDVGGDVFIPGRAELRAILQRFGRPKDLARASLL